MTIEFKKLVNVFDQYEKRVDEKTKEYLSGFGSVDRAPQDLPLMEDVIAQYDRGEIPDGGTIICSARVGDLWSDPTYNRILELRYGNQKKHIESRGGYSNDAAAAPAALHRPGYREAHSFPHGRRTRKSDPQPHSSAVHRSRVGNRPQDHRP